eukprot:scaffold116653_cov25-Prasinocladus_malaysianus.AAC.2
MDGWMVGWIVTPGWTGMNCLHCRTQGRAQIISGSTYLGGDACVMDPENQVGFIDVIALPMLQAVADVFPGSFKLLEQLKVNVQYWRASTAGKGLANCSLDSLRQELVSQSAERYEDVVGTYASSRDDWRSGMDSEHISRMLAEARAAQ